MKFLTYFFSSSFAQSLQDIHTLLLFLFINSKVFFFRVSYFLVYLLELHDDHMLIYQ